MELNNIARKNSLSEGALVPHSLYSGKISCEIAEDFVLPEYLPEIRRLLRVIPTVSSPSKYLSADSLGLSGEVSYCVVYVGVDGRLYSAQFLDAYEINVPFDALSDGADPSVLVFTYSDGTVSRVTGARKINIRSKIVSDIKIVGERTVGECRGMAGDEHMQLLVKSAECTKELFGDSSDSEAVDELELSSGERYVCSDCRVFVDGVSAFSGYVECRGAVVMRHFIERDNGRTYEISRKIPFTETVEMDGASVGMPVTAHGSCVAIISETSEREGNDIASTIVRAQIRICATGYKKICLEYVGDAFSTEYECEAVKREADLSRLCLCANRNMTLSESRGIESLLSDNDGEGIDVCYATVEASAEWIELSPAGRYVINGNCRFNVIYTKRATGGVTDDENGGREYGASEIKLPFRYECSEGGVLPDAFDVYAEAVDPRVRCDGEKIDLGCEIMLSYAFANGEKIEAVENVIIGDKLERRARGYTVCFPSSQDSLWSISKRYCAPVMATAIRNGMDASDEADAVRPMDGTRYMIV